MIAQRDTACFGWRHSLRDVRLDLHLQVELQFLICLVLDAVSLNEATEVSRQS